MELDPNSDEAKVGYKDCAVRMQSGGGGGKDPEEVYSKAMELDPNSDEAKAGYKDCAVRMQSGGGGGKDPEEVRKNAMNNPEVQQIMGDPAMRMILEQMQ